MPNPSEQTARRARDAFRVHVGAAALCAGAQVYLFGAGVALPVALGGTWIAVLSALPLAALFALGGRRALLSPAREGALSRALCMLLALTLLSCACFALCALVSLAQQSLLTQTRAFVIAGMTLLFAALCAASGGAENLCFALRLALPALLLVLAAVAAPLEAPAGLFPVFGAGALEIGVCAACMPGACAPLLLTLLPPESLDRSADVPGRRFFAGRALLGAGAGAALFFLQCALTPYTAIGESWGARLRIAAQPREGVTQTLLTLLQTIALLLLAACTLRGAQRAMARALPRAGRFCWGIALAALLLGLFALLLFGFTPALFFAPLLGAPALALLALAGRMGGGAP